MKQSPRPFAIQWKLTHQWHGNKGWIAYGRYRSERERDQKLTHLRHKFGLFAYSYIADFRIPPRETPP